MKKILLASILSLLLLSLSACGGANSSGNSSAAADDPARAISQALDAGAVAGERATDLGPGQLRDNQTGAVVSLDDHISVFDAAFGERDLESE